MRAARRERSGNYKRRNGPRKICCPTPPGLGLICGFTTGCARGRSLHPRLFMCNPYGIAEGELNVQHRTSNVQRRRLKPRRDCGGLKTPRWGWGVFSGTWFPGFHPALAEITPLGFWNHGMGFFSPQSSQIGKRTITIMITITITKAPCGRGESRHGSRSHIAKEQRVGVAASLSPSGSHRACGPSAAPTLF